MYGSIPQSAPSPTLDLKQPFSQESPTPAEIVTTLLTDTAQPEVSLQHNMVNLHYRTRYWTSQPSAKVLIALVGLAIVSFVPALLTDSHDLQITDGGDFVIEDLSTDEDGVSPISSDATCQDGRINLHLPGSDSRPGLSV